MTLLNPKKKTGTLDFENSKTIKENVKKKI